MNEYDYDLWGLDVNNFEILPAAAVLLKRNNSKRKRKSFRNTKEKAKEIRNTKEKAKEIRNTKELRNNCETPLKPHTADASSVMPTTHGFASSACAHKTEVRSSAGLLQPC